MTICISYEHWFIFQRSEHKFPGDKESYGLVQVDRNVATIVLLKIIHYIFEYLNKKIHLFRALYHMNRYIINIEECNLFLF